MSRPVGWSESTAIFTRWKAQPEPRCTLRLFRQRLRERRGTDLHLSRVKIKRKPYQAEQAESARSRGKPVTPGEMSQTAALFASLKW